MRKKFYLCCIFILMLGFRTVCAEDEVLELCDSYIAELEMLMSECEEQELCVDYERLDLAVIKKFRTHMADEIKNGDTGRMEYTVSCLQDNYSHAKKNLTEYLNGTKKPLVTSNYVTGKTNVEGSSFAADMERDGEILRHPAFLIGYGHFGAVKRDMEQLTQFGVNTIQLETGMNKILKRNYGLADWIVSQKGGVDASVSNSSKTFYDGNYSASIINNSQKQSGRYVGIHQVVDVKPNTMYTFGFYIKADSCNSAWCSANNWDERKYLSSSYGEWTKVEYAFRSGSDETRRVLRINFDGITTGTYIDNVYVCELGSEKNLIKNGSFEKISKYGFTADALACDEVCRDLKNAEDNNISVCLLLSPHYFLDYLYEIYPELKMGKGTFIYFDINHHAAKEAMEEYIKAIIHKVKDYKSLNSIIITNEPAFFPNSNKTAYLTRWHAYLENKYETISKLNDEWGTLYYSFSRIGMPSNFDGEKQIIKDYKDFCDDIFSSWHKWCADLIHDIAPDIPVHAKTMTYVCNAETSGIRFMLSQGLDYEKFSTFSDIGGCDGYTTPWEFENKDNKERNAHEMSFIYDLMTSIKNTPVANSENHMIWNSCDEYREPFAACCGAAIWQAVIHKCNLNCTWLWEREEDGSESFNGSVAYRPDCITEIGRTSLDANRLADEITAIQNVEADIGIVFSNEARVASRDFLNICFNSYVATLYNGKKVRFITDTTTENIDKCKAIILPKSEKLPEIMRAGLTKFIENGGELILVGEGLFSEYAHQKENVKSIDIKVEDIYMTVPDVTGLKTRFEEVFDKKQLNPLKIVDADTGETVDYVEWTYGSYGDNIIVNICNYDSDCQAKKVNIVYNGKTVDNLFEMRSGEFIESEFEIQFAKPIIVKFKPGLLLPGVKYSDGKLELNNKGKYSEIYYASKDGKFVFVQRTEDEEIFLENDKTVMIKNVDWAGNKSMGSVHTSVADISEYLQAEIVNESSSSAEIIVKNSSDIPIAGVLKFQILKKDGGVVQTTNCSIFLPAKEDKIIKLGFEKYDDVYYKISLVNQV